MSWLQEVLEFPKRPIQVFFDVDSLRLWATLVLFGFTHLYCMLFRHLKGVSKIHRNLAKRIFNLYWLTVRCFSVTFDAAHVGMPWLKDVWCFHWKFWNSLRFLTSITDSEKINFSMEHDIVSSLTPSRDSMTAFYFWGLSFDWKQFWICCSIISIRDEVFRSSPVIFSYSRRLLGFLYCPRLTKTVSTHLLS